MRLTQSGRAPRMKTSLHPADAEKVRALAAAEATSPAAIVRRAVVRELARAEERKETDMHHDGDHESPAERRKQITFDLRAALLQAIGDLGPDASERLRGLHPGVMEDVVARVLKQVLDQI